MAQERAGIHFPLRLQLSRGLLVLLAVVAGAATALTVKNVIGTLAHPASIDVSGTIEATESDVAPKVEGRLVDLRVRDGDRVRKGEPLAILERVDPGLNLDQARANVAAAAAQVAVARAAYDLQRQSYGTTLAQAAQGLDIARSRLGQAGENLDITANTAELDVDRAGAELSSAKSAYVKARTDLTRARSLVATGDEPQQTLDDASAQYAAAASQLQAARDSLATAQANLRSVSIRRLDVAASQQSQLQSAETLRNARAQEQLVEERHAQLLAAQAALAQARAALGLAADQVRETRLLAPFDGYAIAHNFEVGDLVAPGAAVLTVGDLEHPYVYVYVSESDLPKIKTGMPADVTIDGMPGRTFAGTITEISDTAEFTPEDVQTKEERIEYLVFRVKVQLYDPSGTLKPGLPADAAIKLD